MEQLKLFENRPPDDASCDNCVHWVGHCKILKSRSCYREPGKYTKRGGVYGVYYNFWEGVK